MATSAQKIPKNRTPAEQLGDLKKRKSNLLDERDFLIAEYLLTAKDRDLNKKNCILLYSTDIYGFMFRTLPDTHAKLDFKGRYYFHRLWTALRNSPWSYEDYEGKAVFPPDLLKRIETAPKLYCISRFVTRDQSTNDRAGRATYVAIKDRELLDEVKFYVSADIPQEKKGAYGFSGYKFADLDALLRDECSAGRFKELQLELDKNKDSHAYHKKTYPTVKI